jgi:hypothetical protein
MHTVARTESKVDTLIVSFLTCSIIWLAYLCDM